MKEKHFWKVHDNAWSLYTKIGDTVRSHFTLEHYVPVYH